MVPVRLESMTAPQFADYLTDIVPPYSVERVAADHISQDAAEHFVRDQHARLLPAGQTTPGHHFQSLVTADIAEPVGGVWFFLDAVKGEAFLYNITVFPQWRRRGYATAALALVEAAARSAGCAVLGLNVFATNTGAAEMYRRAGYKTVSSHMNRRL
jgi:ribosomal protein S18 acetylase RimI-like enzyme